MFFNKFSLKTQDFLAIHHTGLETEEQVTFDPIVKIKNRFFIRDLNTKNGTLVNGALIRSGKRVEVPEGVTIVIGVSAFCLGRECPGDITGLLAAI